jgi:hypothetical protein
VGAFFSTISKRTIRKRFKILNSLRHRPFRGCPGYRATHSPGSVWEQLARGPGFSQSDAMLANTQREVSLSQVFQWYQQDFGVSPEAVLTFISKYRTVDAVELRRGNGKHATDYD